MYILSTCNSCGWVLLPVTALIIFTLLLIAGAEADRDMTIEFGKDWKQLLRNKNTDNVNAI